MKILGMIGGTGPESTVEYYRRLIATYHARVSDSGGPPIIINSVDNKNLVKWFTAGELAAVIDFLAAEIERLARAGADFGLIAAVTPHLGFNELQQRASIPLLSIVEATADAAKKAGLLPAGALRDALHYAGCAFSRGVCAPRNDHRGAE